MRRHNETGFTMVELMTVVVIVGFMLAFAIPAYKGYMQSYMVKSSAENVSGYLRLAREKAVSTGVSTQVHFYRDMYTYDIHVHASDGVRGYKFPKGIDYGWSTGTYPAITFTSDGRASTSLIVPLCNRAGLTDTVSVQTSGMITTY